MYNEVPVTGTKYSVGDWKLIATHDEYNIKGFFGPYKWLSNFHLCGKGVWYEGGIYPSSENAYQAAKILPEYRVDELMDCSPAESKKVWKNYPRLDKTPEEWDVRKYVVMSDVVFNKFSRDEKLRQKLLETGDKYLEETNWWKDTYWGVDINLGGQNNLGKILMKVRDYWK
jgi:ribA/ribD-fused uncharacterized protein